MGNPLTDAWHDVISRSDAESLRALLAENACFHSPVVFRPQHGRDLTAMYLTAAMHVFEGTGFRYVREVVSGHDAVLEFVATIDGVEVNGVDMIHWDEYGRIDDFKVMVRPWKGIEKLRDKMAAMLQSMSG
jgi:hypothetical protein